MPMPHGSPTSTVTACGLGLGRWCWLLRARVNAYPLIVGRAVAGPRSPSPAGQGNGGIRFTPACGPLAHSRSHPPPHRRRYLRLPLRQAASADAATLAPWRRPWRPRRPPPRQSLRRGGGTSCPLRGGGRCCLRVPRAPSPRRPHPRPPQRPPGSGPRARRRRSRDIRSQGAATPNSASPPLAVGRAESPLTPLARCSRHPV